MAAYAASVSLITLTEQIENHPRLSISVDKSQIESLREKIGFLLKFIENNITRGAINNEAQVLLSQIASSAYSAEDAIKSHVVDQTQAMEDAKRKVTIIKSTNSMPLLCCLKEAVTTESDPLHLHQINDGSISLLDLQTVIDDVDSIKKKVMEFKDGLPPAYSVPATTTTTTTTTSTSLTSITGKSTMVGFEVELHELLERLTGLQSNLQIIPIVGMGGIGKTTLAKYAYENSLITRPFYIRRWVTVSQKYDVGGLLLQLLSEQSSEMISKTDEQLGDVLYTRLCGRKYLIVIDDIWSVEAWEKLKRFFPNDKNGSRIVVTTRILDVANDFGSSCLRVNFLDDGKSWKLFCEKAFGDQSGCPSELEDTGKEIVKKCKGLPLSISVIGGLLGRSHKTQEYWKIISKDLISNLNLEQDENCSSILSLSYTYLPPHLKPCFLYMEIFPEDDMIHVSKLIKLWVAEGFIKPNKAQSLEEIARDHLNDLIDMNLILRYSFGSDGRIVYCQIHDLLRDLCLRVAHSEKFICMMKDVPRRLLVGILSQRHVVLDERIPRFVISSEPMFFKELPYSSTSLLWNLQTLILNSVIDAPSEIWEMRQLRHLHILRVSLPDPPKSRKQQKNDIVLPNLQTLKNVMNFKWSEEVCMRLPNVTKLNFQYDLGDSSSKKYRLYNICRLGRLESLTCKSFHLVKLLHNLKFPSSINRLSLEYCKVPCRDLTMISSLPCLEVLKLKTHSIEGREWNPVEGGFLRLKYLLIEDCDLVEWRAQSSHFPVLEKLVLLDMNKLKQIPIEIGEISTLQVLHLKYCRLSAVVFFRIKNCGGTRKCGE
ncbi:hypothetical protein ABFS82_04G155300 [Erythranthe guttata]|uniref:putative late blight resistance protein homolog R1A-10 n=1 Tax=Erythranthe guttata TaxID=4155 RepID=UPI00064DB765|nr:PREDICTED: putative late blight resistance protein homolog R1A-10 [Erythranthe guttata]|eukprot:XP_012856916.1 PREDICTED: putative late blight resistance protein homolog R1A-10 [Erythranthe guttata]